MSLSMKIKYSHSNIIISRITAKTKKTRTACHCSVLGSKTQPNLPIDMNISIGDVPNIILSENRQENQAKT